MCVCVCAFFLSFVWWFFRFWSIQNNLLMFRVYWDIDLVSMSRKRREKMHSLIISPPVINAPISLSFKYRYFCVIFSPFRIYFCMSLMTIQLVKHDEIVTIFISNIFWICTAGELFNFNQNSLIHLINSLKWEMNEFRCRSRVFFVHRPTRLSFAFVVRLCYAVCVCSMRKLFPIDREHESSTKHVLYGYGSVFSRIVLFIFIYSLDSSFAEICCRNNFTCTLIISHTHTYIHIGQHTFLMTESWWRHYRFVLAVQY